MTRFIKWIMQPRNHYADLDVIMHIEDDYYHSPLPSSKELLKYYLIQI